METPSVVPSQPDPATIRAIGLAQRLLCWAVLNAIVGTLIFWFFPYIALITVPFQLYAVYRLAAALRMHVGVCVLFMLAMCLPIISLICLLVLSMRATDVLTRAGINVGFMGARLSDLPPEEPPAP